MTHKAHVAALLFFVACGAFSCSPAQPHSPLLSGQSHTSVLQQKHPTYIATDLGTLSGYDDCVAKGINNQAQIVGVCTASQRHRKAQNIAHAFVWSKGQMRALKMLAPYKENMANGINNKGQIVGSSYNGFFDDGRAVLWQGKAVQDLGVLPGYDFSTATGINDKGQVVGYSTGNQDRPDAFGEFASRAFLWQRGRRADLGTLGGRFSQAQAINNAGQVCGKADQPMHTIRAAAGDVFPPGLTQACLWQNKQPHGLGTLPNDNRSIATAINSKDQVVGYSEAVYSSHAFLWQHDSMVNINTLSGEGGMSIAMGINDSGQVVGYWHGADSNKDRAFLWQEGHATNLDDLLPPGSGWVLKEALAINNRGQIVGSGMHNGRSRAFLLTPLTK